MKTKKASIALISILVISAFTLLLITGMMITSISSYDQSFNKQASRVGYYAAEACLEEALIRLEEDPQFSETSISLDEKTKCLVSISGGSPYLLSISVVFLDYSQNFEAELTLTPSGQVHNAELLSWKEV